MQRKKILWLVSWYPNRNDWFNGDFIQRHARAAAIHHDIHVIFVTDADIEDKVEEVRTDVPGLTEQVVYFKREKGIAARLKKQFVWKNLYQNAVKKYIQKNGLPDCVHVHVPWKAGLIALWMKRKYSIDFMITEHWTIYNDEIPSSFEKRPFLIRQGIKKIYDSAVGVIPVSNDLSRTLQRVFSIKSLLVIHNVADTELFYFSDKKYSEFTFIHVSTMSAIKNVKMLLDAFKIFVERTKSSVNLVLVGNKSNEFVQYAEDTGLLDKCVFFRGEISYREVAQEMRHSHCFVLSSISENSPCVIGEALCCGLPVIATNVGGVPELVNETNGKLVPAKDVDALATAMEFVRDNYEMFDQRKISENATRVFSYAAVSKTFDKLYRKFC